MRKTKELAAMRKLEAELKEEKQAEIRRRREITEERKKAAEERQRLEEDKVKVFVLFFSSLHTLFLTLYQDGGQKSRAVKTQGRKDEEN